MARQKSKKLDKVEPNGVPVRDRPGLIVCLVLLLFVAAIPYVFSLGGQLVLDDKALINGDMIAHSLKNIPKAFTRPFFGFGDTHIIKYYRPFVTVSYIVNYAMFAGNPVGYKVTNLLFHLISTLLVFALGRRMLGKSLPSLLAGLIFAVHPAHAESVAWISGRTDLIATIFALATLLSYGRYMEKDSRRWYVGSAAFFLAGMLSKETVIVLPAMIFVMDRFCRRDSRLKDAVIRTIPFLAVAAVYFAVRIVVFHGTLGVKADSMPVWTKINAAPAAIMWYLKILLLPEIPQAFHNVFLYIFAHPIAAAAGWAGLIGLAAIAFTTRHRFGVVSICILWILLTLLPVTNIIRLPWPVVCERFLYLPSVGFSLIFGIVFNWLIGIRPRGLVNVWPLVSGIGTAGVLIYCAMQTYAGAPLWSNNKALMSKMLELGPELEMIHSYAGETYFTAGDYKRAAEEFRTLLEFNPNDAPVHAKLLVSYLKIKDYESAAEEAEILAKLKPKDVIVHNELGIVLAVNEDHKAAIKAFERALRLDPDNPKILFNLARSLAKDHQSERAILEYKKGLKIKPDDERAKHELDLLLKGSR